jgi:predicted HicB family RNase H-like nuclease
MSILKYKDYEGTTEIDMERLICRGKILFINDLVTYEADSPKQLQYEFESAVNDYIETCKELGRDAQKPLKGQFNVRIPPVLHKSATLRAVQDKASLNDIVVKSLEAYLSINSDINHNLKITVENKESFITRMIAGSNVAPTWEPLNVH